MNERAASASRFIGAITKLVKLGKRPNPGRMTCALPGCEEPVAQLPGSPPRSFCTPDHRAAARQFGAQEARRAAASADTGPGPSDGPLDPPPDAPDAPDAGGARAPHSRRRTLRPALTALAALTVIGGAVPAVLLLGGSGARTEHAPAAHGSPTHTPKSGSGQNSLLAESASWSAGAQEALAGIASQLPALDRAEKAIEDVPANRRSTRANALLRKVRQRISSLTGHQASLSAGLALSSAYQRSTLESAGIGGELSFLRHTQQQAQQARRPVTGGIGGLINGLVKDQNALASQAGTLTPRLRKTVSQAPVAIPVAPTRQLTNQVGDVVAGVLPAAPAPAPSPGSAVAPQNAPSAQPTGAASSGSASVSTRTASPAAPSGPASGGRAASSSAHVAPSYTATFAPQDSTATVDGAIAQAEAAAGAAIRDESRALGNTGVTVTFGPDGGLTVTLGAGAGGVNLGAATPSPSPVPAATVGSALGNAISSALGSGQNPAGSGAPSPSTKQHTGQAGQNSAMIPLVRQLMQWIQWELQFAQSNSASSQNGGPGSYGSGYQDTSGGN